MRKNGSFGHRQPFSALDEVFHLLDSADTPMNVYFGVRMAGVIDETRLRDAVAVALAGHPRARARRARLGWWCRRSAWEFPAALDVDPVEVLTCSHDDALTAAYADFYSRVVPLTASPPLRLCLIHHPDGDTIMVNRHHAVSDGIGWLRLMRSISRAYSNQSDLIPHAPLSAEPVIERQAGFRLVARRLRVAMAGSACIAPDGGQDRTGYGFHRVALTVEQTRALTERRPSNTTVNDVLLAGLHLCVDAWNAEHGKPGGRFSVWMPINLRPLPWRHEQLANYSSMVVISTDPQERADTSTAVKAIAHRTRQVKDESAAAVFVKLVTRLQRLPVPLPVKRSFMHLIKPMFMHTAVLTNLGRFGEPFYFGPEAGETVEMWAAPPVPAPLGLGLGVITVGERLHLCFRYRHPLFGTHAAARFADRYVATLEAITWAFPSVEVAGRPLTGTTANRPGSPQDGGM